MIRAHMATFPLRLPILGAAIERLACQVDKLTVILNEFEKVPDGLGVYENVEFHIPEVDLKDVGKFLPEVDDDDYVFLVDDDIIYPPNYVSRSIRLAKKLGFASNVFGYHGSRFTKGSVAGAQSRRVTGMNNRVRAHARVDQLGTGTVLLMGRTLPKLSEMRGSERFVDVRFARYMFERGISLWLLPRPSGCFPSALNGLDPEDRQTIANSFTRKWPQHVVDEVVVYAGVADAADAVVQKNEKDE